MSRSGLFRMCSPMECCAHDGVKPLKLNNFENALGAKNSAAGLLHRMPCVMIQEQTSWGRPAMAPTKQKAVRRL